MIKVIVFLLNVLKILLVVPMVILGLTLDKLGFKSNFLTWTIVVITYPILLAVELVISYYLFALGLYAVVMVFYLFVQYVVTPIAIVLMIPVILVLGFFYVMLLLLLGEFAK
ncbi:hypothetical protein [Nosocomiicoccus sp. HMSC059G07]|uniref:hypothetical protein n=1 Tax=Nosocomiicoccus sp. HMSC059G07 TaxID=1739531 RepID=UPI0008A3925F|nr:hypothetical protein [Nosocomiicoccus sp. HMSC059G07]OFO55317.1 hypothetical protein HMPREF3029_04670 [Nosocomiicoccus sp. HMSC059G07]